jgi:hypothetical protein
VCGNYNGEIGYEIPFVVNVKEPTIDEHVEYDFGVGFLREGIEAVDSRGRVAQRVRNGAARNALRWWGCACTRSSPR